MTWMASALLAPLMYAASTVIDKYALEQHTGSFVIFQSIGFAATNCGMPSSAPA